MVNHLLPLIMSWPNLALASGVLGFFMSLGFYLYFIAAARPVSASVFALTAVLSIDLGWEAAALTALR